jgi:hypothetical protein
VIPSLKVYCLKPSAKEAPTFGCDYATTGFSLINSEIIGILLIKIEELIPQAEKSCPKT